MGCISGVTLKVFFLKYLPINLTFFYRVCQGKNTIYCVCGLFDTVFLTKIVRFDANCVTFKGFWEVDMGIAVLIFAILLMIITSYNFVFPLAIVGIVIALYIANTNL